LLSKLLNLYIFTDKQKFLPLAYFWIFFLKTHGFLGRKRGWLGSTGALMMLVNYLQTQSLLPNYQDKRFIKRDDLAPAVLPDFLSFLHDERLGEDEVRRFKSMLIEENLQDFDLDPTIVRKTHQIDCWMNDNPENKTLIMDQLQKDRINTGKRYKMQNSTLIIRFFRHLITKTSEKNAVYNI